MRLILYILFILMPMQMMAKSTLATTDIVDEQHLLKLLDEYIDRRELYTEQKEEKIKQLKIKLRMAYNNDKRSSILDAIYREYYTYNYDSAMVYVNRGLSLALSDNIQHVTGTGQRFFFLDEGFGSLDKESLTIVFETLKTLHKENRIVGLISHVEEMQQEIDNYVRVNNTPEHGSIIKCSWEG